MNLGPDSNEIAEAIAYQARRRTEGYDPARPATWTHSERVQYVNVRTRLTPFPGSPPATADDTRILGEAITLVWSHRAVAS